MSSSTSIAAARNRRAGSQAPPPSQSRPGTSIASQSAFAQQTGNRASRIQQSSMQKPVNNTQHDNGLPFTKLTVSDAVGLITLRLGRVEQFIIDLQEERNNNGPSGNLPDNTKLIDNSVLTSIINRLDTLEKKNLTSGNNEQITKLEKDLKEAKDHLLNIILKLDKHITETNNKFTDFETAISDIEKSLPLGDAAQYQYESNNISLNNISLELGELNNDNTHNNEETQITQET